MGKEIYLREYDYLGFYSCQMIVPGVSEVYPIEDLVYNNKNSGKWIRDMILNLDQYDPEEVLEVIEPLEESQNVEKYIGVIFEKNFTIRDLKAQMHLILENWDEALELLEFGNDPMGRIVAELIRMEQDGHKWSDYEEALHHVFTKEKVQKALAIKNGEAWYTEPKLHHDYLRMLEMYDRLESQKSAYYKK
jgi:ribosomal protein S12 methylthiotransferase accessory factor